MNVIFLDIDGVLNSAGDFVASMHRARNNHSWHTGGTRILCPVKIALLEATLCEIEKETGDMPFLVISSTWRKNFTEKEFHKMFSAQGWSLPENIIMDCTPWHRELYGRGEEIQEWLVRTPIKVDNFAIVDDNMKQILDTNSDFEKNAVETCMFSGLRTTDANDIMRIFGCKEHFIVLL